MAEWTSDDGLTLTERGAGRLVRCVACGAVLVVTETHNDDAIRSMVRASVARMPCCDRWRHAEPSYQRFDHGNVYEPPKPAKAKPEIPGQLSLDVEDET